MKPTKMSFLVEEGIASIPPFHTFIKRTVLFSILCVIAIFQEVRAIDGEDTGCHNLNFSTEIIQKEVDGDCYHYQFKVNHQGKCQFALSHYTVGIPCGEVSNVSNSQGWPIELNILDPKTQLYGFKIDDIRQFGEQSGSGSFTVDFTICATDQTCRETLSCWEPVVAYKAGYCVKYETVEANCSVLEASIVSQDITCQGASDGWAEIEITNGTAPFNYLWSNGATTEKIENLTSGNYEVTITDANNQELVLDTFINEPNGTALTITPSNASCNGVNDGTVDLEVIGDNGPYTFIWNTGQTTEDLASVGSGLYEVTVTDAGGCTYFASTFIDTQVRFILGAQITKASCDGNADGSIDLFVDGGQAPYNFDWSNDARTEDIDGLEGGTIYVVTVTDANGCMTERAFPVGFDTFLDANAITTNSGCNGEPTGAIDLNVDGGSRPYSFQWSNGAMTEDITNLGPGDYDVFITDGNGCIYNFSTTIQNETLDIDYEITKPTCVGSADGAIGIEVLNGEGPFIYQWSNGSNDEDISDVVSGVYNVSITDNRGCSYTINILLPDPQPIFIDYTITGASCESGSGLSSIDISVINGTAPYTFDWSNGAQTEDLMDVAPGFYTVIVTDINNCTQSKLINVPEVEDIPIGCIIEIPENTPDCLSSGNILNATVENAVSYDWTVVSSDDSWIIEEGSDTSVITYMAGNENSDATFFLTVTNVNGCSSICEMYMSTCTVPDDGNDDDDDNPQDPGCDDCFDTEIVKTGTYGDCIKYEMTVFAKGNCKKDLSHFTVAIPCGEISHVSNSENWPMEVNVQDPKTGLYGFKVDDIHGFGEDKSSFKVNFKLCPTDEACAESLENWEPVVAYKAGQCITYDNLKVDEEEKSDWSNHHPDIKVYPNPFVKHTRINYQCMKSGYTTVEIHNNMGMKLSRIFQGDCEAGKNYNFDFDGEHLPKDIYYYSIRTKDKCYTGKFLK